jgi:hypothetical protein
MLGISAAQSPLGGNAGLWNADPAHPSIGEPVHDPQPVEPACPPKSKNR